MMPGYGETLICEGDPRLDDERETLLREFRASSTRGCGPPSRSPTTGTGRREAVLVTDFADIPEDAERVLFWPRAAGGAPPPACAGARVAGLGVIVLVVTLGGAGDRHGPPRAVPRAAARRAGRGAAVVGPRGPARAARRPSGARSTCCARWSTDDEWEHVPRPRASSASPGAAAPAARPPDGPPRYRYLIYPHLPVVALLPRSMAPVREYCVQFPDRSGTGGHAASCPRATTCWPSG